MGPPLKSLFYFWEYFCQYCTFVTFSGSFFPHIWQFILTLYSSNITCDCTIITFSDSFIFFLTFNGSFVILGSINITFDCIFVTLGDTLFFSHIWQFRYHIRQCQYHMWLYFCNIQWFFFFPHIWQFHSHIKSYQHYIWEWSTQPDPTKLLNNQRIYITKILLKSLKLPKYP